uniref:Uncharacterized protein n=1 Tax=Vitis vinifera TaxID=29760 RepID=A5ART7_VITVI|nr:hypothetical protein VITISV_028059 [Vitis vinifera]
MMQFSYPDSFKERQMTFQLLLSKEEQTTLAEHRYSDNLHNAYVPSGYNDWIKNLYGLKSRVHSPGNYVDHKKRESLKKMATPSQSRSSGRGEDDNFEWRLAIERRQLASERQLKALLQETERLREENVVLRIQASTSGPPRRQRSRGQIANSRPQQEPESIYPGTTGVIPRACNVRPHEPRTPMPRASREESSDSTHFSAKKTT